jgi:2-keto-4-pentenoate hydratase/2-oxohepta-3-ene-1,7-dioic acid hydratase in catechol pathway
MKIICIGVNYRQHAIEMGRPFPEQPVVFLKPDSAILKNNKPFFLPDFSENIHYEVEVIIKISKLGKGIEAKFAHRYFDEVTLGIDITARDLQSKLGKAGHPWTLAKGFDGSAPLGKFVPVKSIKDINNLDFHLDINDETVQKGNTSDLIFSIGQIIEFVSKFFTLKTGDLIFTGTPSGVGPLKRDDHLVAYMEGKPLLDFFVK